MNKYEIIEMADSAILYLYSIKDEIDLNPDYQRMSDVWNVGKRKLLIDTIINGYDIPKIYFHEFTKPVIKQGKKYKYAVVDGKQRLQSIFEFIDNDINLAEDFVYNYDETIKMAEMTYADISKKFPRIKIKFDSKVLPIFLIRTDDIDIIEDMFSRLNEASPLNAAEKRNAIGGPIPKIIRRLSSHDFFKKRLPISNARYKHYDIAVKLLYLTEKGSIVDTKKSHLDLFVKSYVGAQELASLENKTTAILDSMASIFIDEDPLLRNAGSIPIYFLLTKLKGEITKDSDLPRKKIQEFDDLRHENRYRAQGSDSDDAGVLLELLEYDRLLQTPNDSYSIRYKCEIMAKYIFSKSLAGNVIESLKLKLDT